VPSRIGFRETLRWFGSDLMEARPEYLLEANRNRTIVHHIAEGELFGLMRWLRLRCLSSDLCPWCDLASGHAASVAGEKDLLGTCSGGHRITVAYFCEGGASGGRPATMPLRRRFPEGGTLHAHRSDDR